MRVTQSRCSCSRLKCTCRVDDERSAPGQLDGEDPFGIDIQAAHLFRHPHPGIDDIDDVRASDPLFCPAKPSAHWLMCAETGGRVLMVPLAPSRGGDPGRCGTIGCHEASQALAVRHRKDRKR
jgi:hypothetical protein